VRPIFADTLYWGAVLHPLDRYRAQVIRAREQLGDICLVTTDEVLTELLDGLGQRGTHLREAAAGAVRKILNDSRVTVYRQSRESPLAGLRLYEQRKDKGLQPCGLHIHDNHATPRDFGSPDQRPPCHTRRLSGRSLNKCIPRRAHGFPAGAALAANDSRVLTTRDLNR
jgi:hypothetical protein